MNGHAVVDTAGRRRVRAALVARLGADGAVAGPVSALPCDLIAMSGGWNPAAHLFSQSGGRLRLRRGVPRLSARLLPASGAVRGRGQRHPGHGGLHRRRACRGRGRARGARTGATRDAGGLGGSREKAGGRGKAVRRFPERRHDGGYRAGGPRGLRVGRAPEALHHARHGHRPGQDGERAGAGDSCGHPRRFDPGGGHDHVPPALRPDHPRRHRRAGRGFSGRPGAPDALARLARGEPCRLRGRRPVEAALLLPPPGRDEGRRGVPGMPGRPQRRRRHGREHARQDPGLRSRRAGAPEPRLHQCLGPAGGGTLPVRG